MRCEKQGGKEGTAFLPPHLWHAIGQGSYMSSGFVRLGCLHAVLESSHSPNSQRAFFCGKDEMGSKEAVSGEMLVCESQHIGDRMLVGEH